MQSAHPPSADSEQSQASDRAAIHAAITVYFQAHASASGSLMREPFLSTAHIEGNRPEGLVSWSLDTYCNVFKGMIAPDESTRVRTIDWIDISNDAASARATLVHGPTTFTDYFVLVKVSGTWKIANKVYSRANS